MSHDLRTPITSVMLYTEILKKGAYKDENQLRDYLERIDRKSRRMKQLTDHLFQYSLVTGETNVQLEEAESFRVLFYDLLSETCSYLMQRGFHVEVEGEWTDSKIQICTDYVTRVMDNVTSNIIKYAESSQPIQIIILAEKERVGFCFENIIRDLEEKPESTAIGVQCIKIMMRIMGGKCIIKEEKDRFSAEILFPVIRK